MSVPPDTVEAIRARIAATEDDPVEVDRLTAHVVSAIERRSARSFKRCPRCERERPLAAFGRDSRTVTGLASRCRSCNAAVVRTAV